MTLYTQYTHTHTCNICVCVCIRIRKLIVGPRILKVNGNKYNFHAIEIFGNNQTITERIETFYLKIIPQILFDFYIGGRANATMVLND